MAQNSKIEWCDHTVNLWWGCAKVHTGCKNCYAEYFSDKRYKNDLWGENKMRKRIISAFPDLDKYQKQASKENRKVKVFVGSMMDIFENDKVLSNPIHRTTMISHLRGLLFERIDAGYYPNIIFLFLTKRPSNILHFIPREWNLEVPNNVWFGTSVSNQETTTFSSELQSVAFANLFLSIEPQVGEINELDLTGIDWVIQGGESGHNKRPFDLSWAYAMRSYCKYSNVPYFFKQIDKVQKIPNDLLVREFPKF